jgi:spore coat polysaccharide biosynthesis protein SpsF
MKLVCVQARLGSTRFPKKVLLEVLGKPLLLHQIERIERANNVDKVVVITSTEKENDLIEEVCKKSNIDYFRGSELDLLDRHYKAAIRYQADFVIKIPSDCPLVDPKIVQEVVSLWESNKDLYDYVSNYHPPTFPDGLDVEGCSIEALELAWQRAKKPYEREHTFPYIWDQPDKFKIGNFVNSHGNMFMTHRWTLDYPEDYQFIKTIFEELRDLPCFGMSDVLDLLKNKPEISEINRMHLGVNWYRHQEGMLRTVDKTQYKKTP